MFDNRMPPGVGATLRRAGAATMTVVSAHTTTVNVHPSVSALLDRTGPSMRSVFHGRCPEALLLSRVAVEAEASLAAEGTYESDENAVLDRMRQLLRGAVVTAMLLPEPNDPVHERPIPPCTSCAPALAALEVRILGVPAS
ncbi:YwqJ-related putative deaminase [Streptomyces sp. NBC_01433]|uniref:YwqJ-related putative deaminase n=1 Tax=Streptomyces sp. NBC_01433 TaxID=2903864 RepID=UPI00225A5DE3|nr:YwqJ-related putative deaminase [Streptomyces sp. NBC_01433]MCX4679297.1 YwqJ-related putative deaminase [Streptomyces sp. NBC_01433]